MSAPKNIADKADSTRAGDAKDAQPDLDSMLEGLLKSTPKLAQPGTQADEGQRCGLVAIVGKPNVGKSSLLNALLNYDRAIISDIAGTTRDTIEEEIRIGTHLVKIVDTAGIREAHDVIEKIGIERSILAIGESQIVIAMFDNSRINDDEDIQILNILDEYGINKHILKVLNKSDLEQKFDQTLLGENLILLDCKKNSDAIILHVKNILDGTTVDDSVMLTSFRQIEAVKKAYENIEQSVEFLNFGQLELFAFHINVAIESISSITRAYERDEILDKMFGSFCLGK